MAKKASKRKATGSKRKKKAARAIDRDSNPKSGGALAAADDTGGRQLAARQLGLYLRIQLIQARTTAKLFEKAYGRTGAAEGVADLLELRNNFVSEAMARAFELAGDEVCTLDTEEEVEVVIIAMFQIKFPSVTITPETELESDLDMDEDARATFLPIWVRTATESGGCRSRVGPGTMRACKTVQDVIDAVWEDLQDKCDL
jgi:hypothetical protein